MGFPETGPTSRSPVSGVVGRPIVWSSPASSGAQWCCATSRQGLLALQPGDVVLHAFTVRLRPPVLEHRLDQLAGVATREWNVGCELKHTSLDLGEQLAPLSLVALACLGIDQAVELWVADAGTIARAPGLIEEQQVCSGTEAAQPGGNCELKVRLRQDRVMANVITGPKARKNIDHLEHRRQEFGGCLLLRKEEELQFRPPFREAGRLQELLCARRVMG